MSLKRVKAVLLEEFYITRHSLEVIVDLFLLSVMSVIVFGFFSLFLSSQCRGPGVALPAARHAALGGRARDAVLDLARARCGRSGRAT